MDYGSLSHAELSALRDRAPAAEQGMLAPFEHRAFAREWSNESPILAGLSLPFAIPAYTAAKAMGLTKARSPASLDEIFGGYHGYAEGLLNNVVPSAHAADNNEFDPEILAYLKSIGRDPGTLSDFDRHAFKVGTDTRRRDREDAAWRAQQAADGALARQHLWDILNGAPPQRGLFSRGMPPAQPVQAVPALKARVNGAPIQNPNPSYTPTGGGVRG